MNTAKSLSHYNSATDSGHVSRRSAFKSPLRFKRIGLEDIDVINEIIRRSPSMTCDFTIGGIFMWVDYFKYRYCIYEDTLFITGVEENRRNRRAFSCPIGTMPLPKAIMMLKEYCDERHIPLQFSAIPADTLTRFRTIDPSCEVEELSDWGDYLYDAESFATLSGKKMSKKRNHVNRFLSDHPDSVIEPLNRFNIHEALKAMQSWEAAKDENGVNLNTRHEEFIQVREVLENLDVFPFEGVVMRSSKGGEIVAFTLAEVINNVVFVHIEKMNHEISGAGETIAHLFVKYLLENHPEIKYVNREEDCGDEGLRRAKESWHPLMILKKYNVNLDGLTKVEEAEGSLTD